MSPRGLPTNRLHERANRGPLWHTRSILRHANLRGPSRPLSVRSRVRAGHVEGSVSKSERNDLLSGERYVGNDALSMRTVVDALNGRLLSTRSANFRLFFSDLRDA